MIFIKKYIAFLTVLFLFISGNILCVNAGADIAVGITINGEVIETEVSPFVENGRTLVPVRAVSEHLKYSVEWFEEEQRVDIDSPSDKLTLYIGSADYYKNGEKKTMDVPAVIKDERTFVPLRLVAEEMGCEVKWDEENNIANVIKYNIVEAKTPNDIILNAASYTKIILKEQEYDLSELDTINIDNPNVFADDTFEGYEYIIKDVSNLVIEAPEGINASVVTQAPYANVLSFKGCSGIVLKNITAGHKVEKGYCTGGVIMLDGCRDINIDKCSLYGCGTYGITATDSAEITVENTEIYECTYGLVELRGCDGIKLNGCTFRDSGMFSMFVLDGCSGVSVTNSAIKNNSSSEDSYFISAYDCSDIEFSGCDFRIVKDNIHINRSGIVCCGTGRINIDEINVVAAGKGIGAIRLEKSGIGGPHSTAAVCFIRQVDRGTAVCLCRFDSIGNIAELVDSITNNIRIEL